MTLPFLPAVHILEEMTWNSATRLARGVLICGLAACASHEGSPALTRGPAAAALDPAAPSGAVSECAATLHSLLPIPDAEAALLRQSPFAMADLLDADQWYELVHSESPVVQARLKTLLKGSGKDQYSPREIRRKAVAFYKLANDVPETLVDRARQSQDQYFLQKIEMALAAKNAVDAFEELGLLRSSALRREFEMRFAGSAPTIKQLLSAVLSVPALMHGHLPGYFPKLDIAIAPEQLAHFARVLHEEGTEAFLSAFRARYGRRMEVEFYGRWVVGTYNAIAMSLITASVYEVLRHQLELQRAEQAKSKMLMEYLLELSEEPQEAKDPKLAFIDSIVETYIDLEKKKGTPAEQIAIAAEALRQKHHRRLFPPANDP